MPLAPEWQQPFVNVFKLCDVDTMKEFEKKGDVTEHMDRIIGKKVFKVRGIIPASNFLRVPRSRLQSLGLTGRFLYIQVKVSPVKVFVVHIEAVTADQNIHRVSISNMYVRDAAKKSTGSVKIPFLKPSHRWCVMALDLRAALAPWTSSPYVSIKSIQMCSWLTVRTMFTSDYMFNLQSLPSDMALSMALDSSMFEMAWLPKEPVGAPTMDFLPPPKRAIAKRTPPGVKLPADQQDTDDDTESSDTTPHGGPPPPTSPSRPKGPPPATTPSATVPAAARSGKPPNLAAATAASNVVDVAAAPSAPVNRTPPVVKPFPQPAPGPKALQSSTVGVDHPDPDAPKMLPDPALQLVRLSAYSGEFVRTLLWAPGGNEVVFAAASVVVAMEATSGGRQRHFIGHTAYVAAFALSSDGALLASGQEGKEANIRLWDFATTHCLAIVCGHASGLSCIDLSPDCRALAAVGMDAQARQTIALWNVALLRSQGKVELVTKHATEFNVKVLRFSAYQEDHLMTAGKDSIRVYRLKGGQLRGTSVRLAPPDKRVTSYAGGISAALGPNIFTDIAFEAGVGVYGVDAFRVFVSAASGAVFQVNYNTRSVDCIYQLHSAAINCLLVADGLVVTGSDDRMLRVWPLDFRDFLMEAEHESSVTGLAISPDGLQLGIGTESGTLGTLHVPSHVYTTLLRSHCGSVHAVAINPNKDEFCTVSADGTIRVWDLHTHAQLYEFDAPGESATAVAYHPKHHELAVGFANGRVRVFEVPSTTLVQEHQQHRAPVAELLFSPDGGRMFSGGLDGGLVVYDVPRVYTPVQFLSAGVRDIKVCLAMSSNGAWFASLSRDPYRSVTSLLIFHAHDLQPFMRIETDAPSYVKLAFAANNNELWALTSTRRLDRFELKNGQLVQQVNEVSSVDLTTLAADPNGRYVLTSGNDALLRLWAVQPWQELQPKTLPRSQTFAGHPSAVHGAAFHRGHLVTVGDADCIAVWRVVADASPNANGQPSPSGPGISVVMRSPSDPRTRADPSTAMGPIATPKDHSLSGRSGALGTLAAPELSPTGRAPGAGSFAFQRPADGSQTAGLAATFAGWDLAESSAGPQAGPGDQPGGSGVSMPSQLAGLQQLVMQPEGQAAPLTCTAVVGYTFTGAPNIAWRAATGLFAYVVDETAVVEQLATRAQRYFRGHARPLACLAASNDSASLACGAMEPEPSSSFADITVWDVASGELRWRLKYHPLAVQLVIFSPDDRWLVSVGREPERSVVVWDLESGLLVAAGRTEAPAKAVAWLRGGAAPVFATVGDDGLLLWALQDSYLEQRSVPLGQYADEPTPCTALAADVASGALLVADASGAVWHVEVADGADNAAAMVQVATLPGASISCMVVGPDHALLGTQEGMLVRYSRATDSGTWRELHSAKVDGRVVAVAAEERLADAVVGTSTSTIWFVGMEDGSTVPIVCGQSSPVRLLCPAPHDPQLMASTSLDGMLRVWRLLPDDAEPAVELQSTSACTCTAFLPGGAHLLGGYADGSLRLVSVAPAVTVVWALARHSAPVVAVSAHPRQPLALTASSDGTVAITDMASTRLLACISAITPPTDPALASSTASPRHGSPLQHRSPRLNQLSSPVASLSLSARGPLQALVVSPGAASICCAAWRDGFAVFATPWEDPTCKSLAVYTVPAKARRRSQGNDAGADVDDLSADVPSQVAFVPGTTRLLAFTSPLLLGKVLLYNYRTASVERSFSVPQMVRSMALSPDGVLLVLGGMQRSVFLVHCDTSKVAELVGHASPVMAVAFSADGSRFVSAGGCCLLVWDTAQQARLVGPPEAAQVIRHMLA